MTNRLLPTHVHFFIGHESVAFVVKFFYVIAYFYAEARSGEAVAVVEAVAADVLVRSRNAFALFGAEVLGFDGFGKVIVDRSLNDGVAVGFEHAVNLAHPERIVGHELKNVIADNDVEGIVGKFDVGYRHDVVGHDTDGVDVGRHQIGGLVVDIGVLPNDVVEALFGRKMQHFFGSLKKIRFIFQVQIHQPMPFERLAGIAQRIGAVEGKKLTISTAANRTFNLIA